MDYFVRLLASFLAVMVVITFHEFAHAYVANKCGDPTARFSGRMTLNPLKHFDPFGILMFAVAGFGWAKPVPVNPTNFNNYRKGAFLTSVAGIATNYLMAFILYPVYILVIAYVLPFFYGTYMEIFLLYLFYSLFIYSLNFCAFNLLPFYPLDGFRMIDALKRKQGKAYRFLKQYGQYILLALIAISILADRMPILNYINVLDVVLSFIINIFGKPITLFWDWIFRLFI